MTSRALTIAWAALASVGLVIFAVARRGDNKVLGVVALVLVASSLVLLVVDYLKRR